MQTIILVHGAWGGSYGFQTVRRTLQAQGHEVFTPALTGIGERVHLASPQITLTTHVQDVVNLVLYEDLQDITLVGYSYGGAVVSAALRHIGERIRHLVYLDAFVPGDGQSVFELVGVPPMRMELGGPFQMEAAAREFDDPAVAEFNNARRAPQPMGTVTEAITLDQPIEDHAFSLTYIKATQSSSDDPGEAHFAAAGAHAAQSDRWAYHEVACNHMIPANRPDDLVAILNNLGA